MKTLNERMLEMEQRFKELSESIELGRQRLNVTKKLTLELKFNRLSWNVRHGSLDGRVNKPQS
jgi:hypothetical protein